MLIVMAAAALVLAAAKPETAKTDVPGGASADRRAAMLKLPASDEDIQRALKSMLERDPERLVCSIRVHTGSRQPRKSCSTLRAWFNNRLPGEIAQDEAPWQLVEEIKDQRRKALMRDRAGG